MALIEVRSEITGNVLLVLVGVGEFVEEFQDMLILESMKMEIPITSPTKGAVVSIVTVGEVLQQGSVVAVIESE